MARYSISDTTLTALGDATRRFTTETRIEEWDQFEWEFELQLHGGASSHGYDGWKVVPSDINPIGTNLQNRYIRLKYPEQNYYKFMYMGSSMTTTWDPAVEPELRLPTNTTCYITRTDTIDEPCVLIIRYTDSKDEPMGKHFSQEVPNTLTPGQMVDVLNNYSLDRMIPESALTLTGSGNYRFAYGGWDWFVKQMDDKITTKDIDTAIYMFSKSQLERIPFSINMRNSTSGGVSLSNMFSGANKLVEIPNISKILVQSLENIFYGCNKLESFPEGFAEDWDWSKLDNATSYVTGNISNMFYNCYKLREVPQVLITHGNPRWNYSYTVAYRGFYGCMSLEKIENLFIPYQSKNLNSSYSNSFNDTFTDCSRLKKLTLQTQEDGTPYTASAWKYQTIDLATVGYGTTLFKNYTGFTDETKIDSVEKWHGYIDGSYPDGWAASVEYSTFGATAAKELFATLPDVSGGSNNSVKLKQAAASAIPGEEMTSLTEEDIAVAAAKGWTVTFA